MGQLDEEFFAVTIPFSRKEDADRAKAKISNVLGYGSWVRIGRFGEDD